MERPPPQHTKLARFKKHAPPAFQETDSNNQDQHLELGLGRLGTFLGLGTRNLLFILLLVQQVSEPTSFG